MKKPSIYENSSDLCIAAADFFVTRYQKAIQDHGVFHIALSGGSTPKRLYEMLATSTYCEKIDWSNVHFFFGDERYVPYSHDDSNYRMANLALFSQIDIPTENIHAMPVDEPDAKLAAQAYETELTEQLIHSNNDLPQFDLVLLGLGADGHTASLFPGTDAIHEQNHYCCAVYVEEKQSWRISLTFPIINNAVHILLLSEGEAKREIIQKLTALPADSRKFPIQYVNQDSRFSWYADSDAIPLEV